MGSYREHGGPASDAGAVGPRKQYARALRAVYRRIQDEAPKTGGRLSHKILQSYGEVLAAQRPDEKVDYDYTSISRFLSGERTAPAPFIDVLAFAGQQVGVPVSDEEDARLRRLHFDALLDGANPEELNAYLRDKLTRIHQTLADTLRRMSWMTEHHARDVGLIDHQALVDHVGKILGSVCPQLESLRAERDLAREAQAKAAAEIDDLLETTRRQYRELEQAGSHTQSLEQQLARRPTDLGEGTFSLRELYRLPPGSYTKSSSYLAFGTRFGHRELARVSLMPAEDSGRERFHLLPAVPLAVTGSLVSHWLGGRLLGPVRLEDLAGTLVRNILSVGIGYVRVLLLGVLVNQAVYLVFRPAHKHGSTTDPFARWRITTHAIIGAGAVWGMFDPLLPSLSWLDGALALKAFGALAAAYIMALASWGGRRLIFTIHR